MTPFFQAGDTRTPTALLFYDRRFGETLRGSAQLIVADQRTAIGAVDWSPHRAFRLAGAVGVGRDAPFGAVGLVWDRPWLALRASYGRAGAAFRRLPAEGPVIAEADRENVRVQLRPARQLGLIVSRQQYLPPAGISTVARRSTVNGASLALGLRRVGLQGSL